MLLLCSRDLCRQLWLWQFYLVFGLKVTVKNCYKNSPVFSTVSTHFRAVLSVRLAYQICLRDELLVMEHCTNLQLHWLLLCPPSRCWLVDYCDEHVHAWLFFCKHIPGTTHPTVANCACYLCGGLVAEWLACWTQAQKGLGSNHRHNAVG